jgi:4-hydroxybenzoate polyprenyltransferase
MLSMVSSFLGLVRFSHTLFALPFALTSAALAWHKDGFRWGELIGIVACMTLARNVAMAFNRIADRDIDRDNPRTASRHLPAGLLTVRAVALFAAVNAGLFVLAAAWLFPRAGGWPLALSGPVLAFICAYSLTKRFTALAHFWLGASLFLAPMSAWIAIRGMESLAQPALLGGAVLFWVAGFDILYACQDAEFDRKAKLHSVPAALGVPGALRVAQASHAVMMGLLAALYFASPGELGVVYLAGVALTGALLVYEHLLVRPDDLSRVNQAFFQVNAVISVGLFFLVLVQLAVGV